MSDIKIKIADLSDIEEVTAFLYKHFLPFEPLQMFHYNSQEKMEPLPPALMKDCITSQTTLLALVGTELVGVLIAGEFSAETPEICDEEESFGAKADDIFGFLEYIEKKADYFNRLSISRSLHVHILNIHGDYLRRGIAHKLFGFCVENGRNKNFPALSVDCTSFFTSKIAEKFDMKCLSTVTYEEYNKLVGKTIFIPCEPHKEIKSYAKKYD